MTRTVHVTKAQRDAARALIERAAITGKPVPQAVLLIANARKA